MNNYMLLSRLISDCEFFIGHGNGNEKSLWANDVNEQYEKMKELYNSFSIEEKPIWTCSAKIEDLYEKMKQIKESNNMIDKIYDILIKHTKESDGDFYIESSISYPKRGKDFDSIILGEYSEKICIFFFKEERCIVVEDEEFYLSVIASNPTLSVLDALKKNDSVIYNDINTNTVEENVKQIILVIQDNIF